MSTIYCDLKEDISVNNIKECLSKYYFNSNFVHIVENDDRIDFFKVQNTNNCFINFLKIMICLKLL